MGAAPIAVIGAGLAGSAAAAALARAGHRVDLIADAQEPAASALPLGVLRPHLAGQSDPLYRIRRHGLRATQSWMAQLSRSGFDNGLRAHGAIALPTGARARARRDRLPAGGLGDRVIEPAEARALAGVELVEAAIYHPRGACIAPATLATALRRSDARRIRELSDHARRVICRGDGRVDIALDTGSHTYRQVVLATGASSEDLLRDALPGIEVARGQATAIAATPASRAQRLPVSGDGYVTPAFHGVHWAGATLQRGERGAGPRPNDDRANAARFVRLWPDSEPISALDRFVSTRLTTRDRLPVVGCLEPGLWVSIAHGSHGLCTALLSGLLLARAISGRPPPLLQWLDPGRRALHRHHSDTTVPGI